MSWAGFALQLEHRCELSGGVVQELVEVPHDALTTGEAMRAERRSRAQSEAREFALAAHFCDLFRDADAASSPLPGQERLVSPH